MATRLRNPHAAKTDGEADNDLDVDAVDLGFWEAQFGSTATTSATTLAIGGGEAFEAASLSIANPLRSVPVASIPVADAYVINAAIALAVTELSFKQIEDEFVSEDPVLLEFLNLVTTKLADEVNSRSDKSTIGEQSTSRTSVKDELQEQDMSDDIYDVLLSRIFG